MPDQVPEAIKSLRSEIMRGISLENKTKYFQQMKGKSQRLLIERIDGKGIAKGYGENYIPIQLSGENLERNNFIEVILNKINHQENENKMAFEAVVKKNISSNNCLYQ